MEKPILSDIEKLAKAEYAIVRYRLVDYVSRMVGTLFLAISLLLIVFAILTFGAGAAVFALAQCMPTWAACLIIGAVFVILIPVVILGGTVLFVNPVVRKLSGMKNAEQLQLETLKAEGEAAVRKERIASHVRHITDLWATVTHLFSKKK